MTFLLPFAPDTADDAVDTLYYEYDSTQLVYQEVEFL